MNVLFWNTHKNENINPFLYGLVNSLGLDLLILAEYYPDQYDLDKMLYNVGRRFKLAFTEGCKRIHIWHDERIKCESAAQTGYYSIQIVNDDIILCCVHMPSDLYGDEKRERAQIAADIMTDIKYLKQKLKTDKVIITGDMNDMPYDDSCLNANGFHGLPTLSSSEDEARVVKEISYIKYYNPMWNLFGDMHYPPGTYHRAAAKLQCPRWYMFDQVIMSQSLVRYFRKDKLEIITSFGDISLADRNGYPNIRISDHFPIFYVVEEGGEDNERN